MTGSDILSIIGYLIRCELLRISVDAQTMPHVYSSFFGGEPPEQKWTDGSTVGFEDVGQDKYVLYNLKFDRIISSNLRWIDFISASEAASNGISD